MGDRELLAWREVISPLRTALVAAPAFVDEPGFRAFEAGTSSAWTSTGSCTSPPACSGAAHSLVGESVRAAPLGCLSARTQEELRQFLLGEMPFPQHILLIITLSEKQNALNNRNMSLPFGGGRSEKRVPLRVRHSWDHVLDAGRQPHTTVDAAHGDYAERISFHR